MRPYNSHRGEPFGRQSGASRRALNAPAGRRFKRPWPSVTPVRLPPRPKARHFRSTRGDASAGRTSDATAGNRFMCRAQSAETPTCIEAMRAKITAGGQPLPVAQATARAGVRIDQTGTRIPPIPAARLQKGAGRVGSGLHRPDNRGENPYCLIQECSPERKCYLFQNILLPSVSRIAPLFCSTRWGRPMTSWKKQVRAHGMTAGVRDPESKETFSETTSGTSRGHRAIRA
jgi:hypothetical protein